MPSTICSLLSLTSLNLSYNELLGEIPECICNLSLNWSSLLEDSYTYSYIINNRFCEYNNPGCLPDFQGDNSCYEEFIYLDDIIGRWEYSLFEMDQAYCDDNWQCMECVDNIHSRLT